jgi:hypothetical protein
LGLFSFFGIADCGFLIADCDLVNSPPYGN